MTVIIKDWFMAKKRMELGAYYQFCYNHGEVVKETEKAYLISFEYCSLDGEESGFKEIWCPKSVVMTEEEIANKEAAFNNACNRYEAMIEFAKKNGLKVRKRMKKETVLRMIAAAGLSYAY